MRKALPIVVCLLAACHSEGQLVLGLATDLTARGQLDEVSLSVTRRGETTPIVSHSWDLSGVLAVDYRLPGSFNLYAENGHQPTFDVTITGLLNNVPKVVRTSSLGIVADRELFVRLGLSASCAQIGCPSSLTCSEGQCVARFIDPRRYATYRPELVDHLECDSGTKFIDTSSHELLPISGSCDASSLCSEGTCLNLPTTLPHADMVPFVGGHGEIFADVTVPGAFFEVGALDEPRFFGTATPLADGRVVVVGGFSSATSDGSAPPVPGAVMYDPAHAAFRRLASPPVAVGGHTATMLSDGTVLFVGSAADQPVAFTFDPDAESFAPLPAPAFPRHFHTATLLPSGEVLIFGGTGSGLAPLAERFDPMSRTFSTITAQPIVPRAHHQASLLPDGRVLFTGGLVADNVFTDRPEYYQPATDDFAEGAVAGRARAYHTATVLSDGNVLLVGGFAEATGPANADAELYVTGTMTPDYTVGTPPVARGAQQAIALRSGKVLFVGGAATLTTTLAPAGGAYLYDPTTHDFVSLPEPSATRVAAFAAALTGSTTDDVLIGGGTLGSPSTGSDGGLMTDAGVDGATADMTLAPCDPVTLSSTCSGATPVCTVSGASIFGPQLSTIGPRCVAAATETLALGSPCTAGDAAGTMNDSCGAGAVCMTDVSDGTPRCQSVCHTDMDCGTGRTRCALLAVGTNVKDFGVCMPACDYDANAGQPACAVFNQDMGSNPTVSCHFTPNQAQLGAPVELQGICRYDGSVTVTGACDETAQKTACSGGNYCTGPAGMQTCDFMCSTAISCDGMTCTPIGATDTSGDGYCL